MAHCALRTAEHLVRRGHDPLVVAAAGPHPAEPGQDPCPVASRTWEAVGDQLLDHCAEILDSHRAVAA